MGATTTTTCTVARSSLYLCLVISSHHHQAPAVALSGTYTYASQAQLQNPGQKKKHRTRSTRKTATVRSGQVGPPGTTRNSSSCCAMNLRTGTGRDGTWDLVYVPRPGERESTTPRRADRGARGAPRTARSKTAPNPIAFPNSRLPPPRRAARVVMSCLCRVRRRPDWCGLLGGRVGHSLAWAGCVRFYGTDGLGVRRPMG